MTKQRYRLFCRTAHDLPIFLQDWWLDAVCGEVGWDASVVTAGDRVVAVLPYTLQKRYGLRHVGQPPLTQFLGPWTADADGKPHTQLTRQMNHLSQLLQQLPDFHLYSQNWHHSQTNWLPFYWEGFKQTTRYTYRISPLKDIAAIWPNLHESTRREIRKAKSRYRLSVNVSSDLDSLIDLSRSVFTRQALEPPYSGEIVRRIDAACHSRDRRRIFTAVDPEGRIHAAIYVIWDLTTAYYLMGGADPSYRNSGAMSLCLWEAISSVVRVKEAFDFEGSMIQPIERFFRGFGASQTPYMHVRKAKGEMLSLLWSRRNR